MGAESGDVAEEEHADDEDQKIHSESVKTWGQVEVEVSGSQSSFLICEDSSSVFLRLIEPKSRAVVHIVPLHNIQRICA